MRVTIEFDAGFARHWMRLGGAAVLFAALIAVPVFVYGGVVSVTVPNTFTAGTTASASQVNANFTALQTGINTLGTNVGDLSKLSTTNNSSLVAAINSALQASQVQTAASAPASPLAGSVYFDTTANALFYFDGTQFDQLVRKLPSTSTQTTTEESQVTLGSSDYVSSTRVLSFTKQSASTLLKITYNDSIQLNFSSYTSANISVYIDTTNVAANVLDTGSGDLQTIPVTIFTVASGIAAGSHNLAVHVSGDVGAKVILGYTNHGNITSTILVDEVDP